MAKNSQAQVGKEEAVQLQPTDRQKALEELITVALQDASLVEALKLYEIGQQEYVRAVAGSVSVKKFSSSTANLGEQTDAVVDRD